VPPSGLGDQAISPKTCRITELAALPGFENAASGKLAAHKAAALSATSVSKQQPRDKIPGPACRLFLKQTTGPVCRCGEFGAVDTRRPGLVPNCAHLRYSTGVPEGQHAAWVQWEAEGHHSRGPT
jgi:hypothetical protein